jgi:hypothetical protein
MFADDPKHTCRRLSALSLLGGNGT